MAEVRRAKSASEASSYSLNLLLGIAGGSNQPIAAYTAYSRRSELTSGIMRNALLGRTLT